MSNRAFGVEIECYFPDGCVENEWNRCSEGHFDAALDLFISNGLMNWGDVIDDSSLEDDCCGIEIRTPILRGAEGYRQLKKALDLLYKNGAWVNESCGMHVHHDAPEFVRDEEAQKRLLKSWYDNSNTIRSMVDPSRIDSVYAPAVTLDDVEEFLNDGYLPGERLELNLNSLYGHGSIEIRLHEGTLNSEEALAWVDFGQKFIDNVANRKNSISTISDQELLLRRIKVKKASERFLRSKAQRNSLIR